MKDDNNKNMEFIDLKAQYKHLQDKIDEKVHKVLHQANFIMGQEINELENELKEYIDIKYCISVANGTDALLLSLMALEIGNGDGVFVPTFTFMSTAEVVVLRNATPIFVDVLPDTFNIDCENLEFMIIKTIHEKKIKPKAIIPVDLFGLPANYKKIIEIAKKYSLFVIEDAAQSFGGSFLNKKAGSFGDVGTTSFFPAKPLGCYGDGGAIFTNNDDLAETIRSIRVHGKGKDKYDNIRIGVNSRLDTIQAAILLVKLQAFKDYELEWRNKWANFYSQLLNGLVRTPFIPNGMISSWAQYSILCKSNKERNELQKYLKENNIPSMVYYERPLHLQSAYTFLGYHVGDFPVAEKISNCILSLPIHPYLCEEEVINISNIIRSFFQKNNHYI